MHSFSAILYRISSLFDRPCIAKPRSALTGGHKNHVSCVCPLRSNIAAAAFPALPPSAKRPDSIFAVSVAFPLGPFPTRSAQGRPAGQESSRRKALQQQERERERGKYIKTVTKSRQRSLAFPIQAAPNREVRPQLPL